MIERQRLEVERRRRGADRRTRPSRRRRGSRRSAGCRDTERRPSARPSAALGTISASRAEQVVPLAAVEVAVGGDQHARLDLAEAIEHALHAEVRRARRPDRADRRRAERRDDRLGHVRQVPGDAIAGLDARAPQRRREPRRPRRTAPRSVSVRRRPPSPLKMIAGAVVAPAQQVLGEVQRGVGKEARAGHAVEVVDDARARVAADAAEVPDGRQKSAGRAIENRRARRSRRRRVEASIRPPA